MSDETPVGRLVPRVLELSADHLRPMPSEDSDLAGNGTRVPPSPTKLQRDQDRAVIRIVHQSLVRLQVAEAERQGLNYIHNGRQLDDQFLAIGRMSHAARLTRLAELGERTDDLALPEPRT